MVRSAWSVVAALVCLNSAEPVHAQQAPTSMAASSIEPGDAVVVARVSAPKLKGVVVGVTAVELTLDDGYERRRIPAAAVERIWRDDPVWNGAMIGAGVGAAAMGVMIADCRRHDSECRGVATGIGLIATGGMTLVGVTADYFMRRVVYQRNGLRASVVPIGVARGSGVAVRVRF